MIPFNKPYVDSRILENISVALDEGFIRGNGPFTKECEKFLSSFTGCRSLLLAHSCTAALDVATLSLDIKPGDEVIMPSYTFVSTALPVVTRGGIPVFADIDRCLNIDPYWVETLLTNKTKAIYPVHYAGVGCDMGHIMEIATQYDLHVVEDAAQCLDSWHKGKHLGTFGHFGTLSFHETKNLSCGEGGALLVNNEGLDKIAEIVREYGTDRSAFLRGDSDWYTWRYFGTDALMSEVTAAMLCAQLENVAYVTYDRLATWLQYMEGFQDLEEEGRVRRPHINPENTHNAHIFYLIVSAKRDEIVSKIREQGVQVVPHYQPLHQSPFGSKFARGALQNTEHIAEHIIRLPLWPDMTNQHIDTVIDSVNSIIREVL